MTLTPEQFKDRLDRELLTASAGEPPSPPPARDRATGQRALRRHLAGQAVAASLVAAAVVVTAFVATSRVTDDHGVDIPATSIGHPPTSSQATALLEQCSRAGSTFQAEKRALYGGTSDPAVVVVATSGRSTWAMLRSADANDGRNLPDRRRPRRGVPRGAECLGGRPLDLGRLGTGSRRLRQPSLRRGHDRVGRPAAGGRGGRALRSRRRVACDGAHGGRLRAARHHGPRGPAVRPVVPGLGSTPSTRCSTSARTGRYSPPRCWTSRRTRPTPAGSVTCPSCASTPRCAVTGFSRARAAGRSAEPELAAERPRVVATAVEALGLLHHHRGQPAGAGTAEVAVAEPVAGLVVDHEVAVVADGLARAAFQDGEATEPASWLITT